MKRIFGYIVIIAGLALGAYLGGWLLFIKPLINAGIAINAGTATAIGMGITIVKCLFAWPLGVLIAYVGLACGVVIGREEMRDEQKRD